MIWPLVRRNLRHHARLLLAMIFGLFVFEILVVWAAAAFEQGWGLRRLLEQVIPPQARPALGAQLGMVSFPAAAAFGFQHPATFVAAMAFMFVAGTIPADERESGFLDLVLARPVPRAHYFVAVLVLLVLGAALLPTALLTGAAVALVRIKIPDALPWWRYIPAAAGFAALLLAVGGCTLFFAAGARRRGQAIGRAVGLTLAFFVLEFLADFYESLARIRWLSPFHYFKPVPAAVVPHTPVENPVILLVAFAALSALALVRFQRQDL
jgi:ABC-2 type transport system permease protein